jgi:hypothetical protein
MRKIKNVIVKVVVVVFVLSFISMVMAVSPFLSNSPAISKVLDTIAVSGFVCFFAIGTVACAYTLNNGDFGSNHFLKTTLKAIVYFSGTFTGTASLGFVVMMIIKNINSTNDPYYLAPIVGMMFLILTKKILKTTFIKNKS